MNRKTIFIPIFSGIEGKNILRSGIYEALKKSSNLEFVFFVGSEVKADYYRKEFGDERTTFSVIKKYQKSAIDRLFGFLKFYGLRTKTIDLKRQTHLEETGNPLTFTLSFMANRLIGNRLSRRVIRFFDERFVRVPAVALFFDKYRPSLVFLADLFDDAEAAFLREAKRRGIATIGYLSTWDRVTSRWMIRLLPDYLVVFNKTLKWEAARYADMPLQRIFVSGAVQLDYHFLKPPRSREAVCRELGITPETKFIVYGPLGRTFDKTKQSDIDVVALLNRFAAESKFGPGKFKIVVRFPPNDFINQEELPELPYVHYDIPGIRFGTTRGQDWDMPAGELDRLRDLLAHAALVICYYSSLSVDAAVFDRPVININFFPREKGKRHRYYETTHYDKVKEIGGIRLVGNEEELLQAIKNYLVNPALDRDKRQELVRSQGLTADRQSAKRIAAFILSKLPEE